jgi:lipoprotein-releasing system permease protein
MFYYLILLSIVVLVLALVFGLKRIAFIFPTIGFDWFLAKTYFGSAKNKGFISLISTISIIGMFLGSASVIIAASFMNGMQQEVKKRVIATDSHIKVRAFLGRYLKYDEEFEQNLLEREDIKAVSSQVVNAALIGKKFGEQAQPVIIHGLDTKSFTTVSDVQERVKYGEFALGEYDYVNNRNQTIKLPGIVLGKHLAESLNLSLLDTGKRIIVTAIPNKIDFKVSSTNTVRGFIFKGVVDLGFPEYDLTFAYTSKEAAQKLFLLDEQVSFYDVVLTNPEIVDQYAEILKVELDYPMTAETWKEQWAVHFALMEWEKEVYMICLSLIIILAAFNILSTLYMLVKDKTKDIGILKSIGTSSKTILYVFINQGLIIGVLGALGGLVLSMYVLLMQDHFKFISFPANTLIIDYLPVLINPLEVVYVMIFTIIIGGLAGIYPAFKATKLNPVEAFRYE